MFEKVTAALRKAWHALAKRSVVIPIVCAIIVLCMTLSITAVNTFVVYDGNNVLVCNSFEKSAARAFEAMDIELGELDTVDMPEEPVNGVAKIHINRAFDVSLTVDGTTKTVLARKNDTVADVLERAGVTLGAQDIVNPAPSSAAESNLSIAVTRYLSYKDEKLVDIPFTKETRKSAQMDKGTTKVIQKGSKGQKKQVYQVIIKDGETTRTLLREEVVKEATPQIVQVGTRTYVAGPGTLTSRNGASLRYKKAITVTATAYTTENQRRKTTATGAVARVGLIAVDPRVIPLGSRLYITSTDGKSWVYGTAVAADTGGSIKGNRIDLFFNTRRECISFGRRKAIVYVLE